jgi:hypothetical protein
MNDDKVKVRRLLGGGDDGDDGNGSVSECCKSVGMKLMWGSFLHEEKTAHIKGVHPSVH